MSPLQTIDHVLDTWIIPILSRFRTRKSLFLLGTFSAVVLFLYTSVLGSDSSSLSQWTKLPDTFGWLGGPPKSTCSAKEYASGQWVRKPYYTRPGPLSKTAGDLSPNTQDEARAANMTKPEDILTFARFGGCASSREFWWHLAADREEQWDRFPGALDWEWVPGGECASGASNSDAGLREWQVEEVVRDLVEGGGWLLVGDSVTENHFFSLSCLLYPHVIATPDYTKSSSFDRAWPQHLFLNPDSPLLRNDDTIRITKHQAGQNARQKLRLPPSFNISSTPLVTFRRIDLLWSQSELTDMHKELHPEFYTGEEESFKLFGDEAVWSISPDEYTDLFLKPLPEGHYTTMVVSTAGHWTTNLFAGYKNESDDGSELEGVGPVYGYDGLLQFFEEAMERWAQKVQQRIDASPRLGGAYPPGRNAALKEGRSRQVVVRAYLPGHEECHDHREAWAEIQPFRWNWYNWAEIPKYNQIFENLLSSSKPKASSYKNVHYLAIDRPGRLRPDAHASGDCLHIMTGAGVLEGWSHYIWHFITREI